MLYSYIVNDHTSNEIYLITFDKCKLQYVGETCYKLNNRFNWHNSCFDILKNTVSERFLTSISKKGSVKISHIVLQSLKILKEQV